MKVHEYQAKELLKSAGVAVPEGIVVDPAPRRPPRRTTRWAAA